MPNEFKVKNGLIVDQGGANITGSSLISGSLAINASGSSVFTVDGTSGRLFSVDDSLSGSLFSVNTVAGLPIMEAFSDNTVRIGQYGKRALFVSQSFVGVGKETALNATLDVSGSAVITGSLSVSSGITGSLFGSASYAFTASYALNAGGASIDTGSFATTGSNRFIGNQIITGSLITSGSNTLIGNTSLTGSLNVSGSTIQVGNNTLQGNTLLSGSIGIVGNSTLTGSFLVSGSTFQTGNNTLIGNTLLSGSITISGSYPVGSYASSVNIYGDTTMTGYLKFNPESTNIDTSISASYIFVSGSTQDLYFSQNSKGYNNVTRLRWLEGNLYTGLLNGGLITTQSSTVYQVSSGSGVIVSMNASISDNPYPTTTFIQWPNLSANIAPLSASFDQSFVAIENVGGVATIYVQGTPYDNGEFNTLIPIGNVIHQNRSTINATATYPSVAYAYKQRSSDFIRAFGALKLSGLNTFPSGSSVGGLVITSGTSYNEGRNYITDPNNPSYVSDLGQPNSKIFRYYSSGSGFVYLTNGGAGFTAIDPAQYNNNGTLEPVANNKWTLQRVFYFPGGATKGIYVYYGNAIYDSLLEAIANIPTENFNEAPNTAAGAILSSVLVVQGNADFTNIATYSIRQAGLFRNVGGSGGGGTIATNRLVDLSDVNIISPTNHQPLVYDSTTLKWMNQSTLTANLVGNADSATQAVSASYAATASLAPAYVLNSSTSSMLAPYVLSSNTASFITNSQTSSMSVLSASFASTASSAENFTVRGTLTAQTIVVQTITSSTDFVTGSSKFGSLVTDTHQFTGSLLASSITGSLQGTSSWATSASYVVNAISASYVSGSSAIITNLTSSNDARINGLRIGRGSNNQIENTVVGDLAFVSNLTGTRNTAVGFEALYSNSTGRFNTAYGMDALYFNSVGQENVAIGYSALQNNRSGSFNTILGGSNTAYEITSGSYNTILGTNSGRTITIGNNNTIIGGRLNNSSTPGAPFTTTMSDNVILGDGKGYIRYRFDGVQNNFYDNIVITGSVTATLGFTGSLFGTAATASYVLNSVSASYAATTSLAPNYVLNSSTSSFIISSQTGSFITNSQTSSMSVATASYVVNSISSSYASTASFVNVLNQNVQISGSLTNGENVSASSSFSHAEGTLTKTGIKNAYYATSVISGLIILSSSYGNVTSNFGVGNILILDSSDYDGGYTTYPFRIDSVVYNAPSTQIQLVDITATTETAAVVGDLTLGIDSWTGDQTINSKYAHAEGIGSRGIGISSHAEGNYTQTTGNASHAEGDYTKALGLYSHAEGRDTIAFADVSHAEGRDTITNGSFSHAEGEGTITEGYASHTEGDRTVASGSYSHAEGMLTTARGDASHAEGSGSIAIGKASHAEGLGTVALGVTQHVQGQYNISSSAQSAFIIGNGTSNTARQNLVFASGSVFQITGSLKVSGSITGSLFGTSSWAQNATTSSYIVNAISASFAATTSLAPNYVLNSSTSSFIISSQTGSFVTNSQTSSMSVATASFASTASLAPAYVLNSSTSSMLLPYVLTSVTASMLSPYVLNSNTSSFVTNNQTGSFITNSQTSSMSVATASYVLNAVSSSYAATAALAPNYVLNLSTSSMLLPYVLTSVTSSMLSPYVLSTNTGSFITNSQTASMTVLSSSFAATASSAENFTVRGTLTAQTIVVQTITSSVDFVTGSTRFGSLVTDTHKFTGSVSITGSLAVNGSNAILTNQTSSMSVSTASYVLNSVSASYAATAALAPNYVLNSVTASMLSLYVLNSNTSSFVTNNQTSSFATTGSNRFIGDQTITGSLILSSSAAIELTVIGNQINTGSLIVTQGITGSLLGSSSFATTASYSISSSFALSASWAPGGVSSPTFPYTGSAIISGSLTVIGSIIATQGISGSFSGSYIGNGSGLTGIIASAAPAGPNASIQFNDAGATSGSGAFTFTKATNTVKIQGSGSTLLHVSGSGGNLFSIVDSGSDFPTIATFSSGSLNVLTVTTSSVDITGSVNITGSLLLNGSPVGGGGSVTGQIILTAGGGWPSITNGCQAPILAQTTTNQVNFYYLSFADGSQQFVNWAMPMPSDYNGGTITATFYWISPTATTGVVVWGLQAQAYNDSDLLDSAFGTAQTVSDADSGTIDDVNISAATSAITIGGSPAAGSYIQFRAYRDGANGSDTLTGVAELLSIRITYTRT